MCAADASFVSDSNNCGSCGHSCLGGACVGAACQPVQLAARVQWPVSIAVDDTNVYWGTWGATGDGVVMQANKLNGGMATPLSIGSNPQNTSVVSDGTSVYWIVHGGLGEGLYKTFVGGGASEEITGSGVEKGPLELAFDPTAHLLFWENQSEGSSLTVRQIGLDGGGEKILTRDSTGAGIGHVAVDDHFVYFTDSYNENTIKRVARDGGCPDASNCGQRLIPTGEGNPRSFAVDDASLYWAQDGIDHINSTSKSPQDGGAAVIHLASLDPDAGYVSSMLVDTTDIYLSLATGSGLISKFSKTGVPSLPPWVPNQAWPLAICADATAIYWITAGTNTGTAGTPAFADGDGAVWKIAK